MTEDRIHRHLAAILATDVVGYSRLMEQDELGTLAALKKHRAELFDPTVAAHNGRIVKLMGDGALVEFASVTEAVQCAIDLQRKTVQHDPQALLDRTIKLRIGINLGDVIVEGEDIYGDGVNVAARLESLADPSGICISGTVHDSLGGDLARRFEFIGEQRVKNIEKPVRAFRIAMSKAPSINYATGA
jgi:class 3 adenylate cyclase